MGKLQERLERMKAGNMEKMTDAVKATMAQGEAAIRATGIMDRIIQPGAALPAFAMADANNQQVRSEDLLGRGPLVLTFYRGAW